MKKVEVTKKRLARALTATFAAAACYTLYGYFSTPAWTPASEFMTKPARELIALVTPDQPEPPPARPATDWQYITNELQRYTDARLIAIKEKAALQRLDESTVNLLVGHTRAQAAIALRDDRATLDRRYQDALALNMAQTQWHHTSRAFDDYLEARWSPTLFDWLTQQDPQPYFGESCLRVTLPADIENIICNGPHLTKVAFERDTSGLKKTYDFTERAAFYDLANDRGAALIKENFTQVDPARLAEIFALKTTVENDMDALRAANRDLFNATLPQILREIGLSTPACAPDTPRPC